MFSFGHWFRSYVKAPKTSHRAQRLRRRFQPGIEPLEERCVPSTTYTVSSLADSGPGTLRAAITQANTNNTGTATSPDLINFTNAGSIMLASELPALTDIAVIDGSTAPGYSGTPVITLEGSGAGAGAVGLTISGGSSTVKALAIVNFSGDGIALETNGGDTVLSSYIGLDTAGAVAGNGVDGIFIAGTSGNTIGSTTAIGSPNGMGGNVVSGNLSNGIGLLAEGIQFPGQDNVIEGNHIGTNVAGTAARGNGVDGILCDSAGNTVGGAAAGAANVISGNGADGILLTGPQATHNAVIANFIGTNLAGSAAVGNGGSGIEITSGANQNTIGGNTPTGSLNNAPPAPGKPPDGNVVSGNGAYGILLTNSAASNTLSGNFAGTDLTGLKAVGNALDGIAILNGSNNNALLGTTATQLPFVYLNLVSGNGGNGLRINNSNGTVVNADAFGIGDDNVTAVGNRLDGVLIEGSSASTMFGGMIPLGNISSGNGRNGVEIADTASGTDCFNTFAGPGAFTQTALGNVLDGFLITSTGGNNVLQTNVISGNGGNGVHLAGNATGVTVEDAIIGLTTNGKAPLPNAANGVLLDGNANHNLIGGQQTSVIMQNVISENGANGIEMVGNASNNVVNQSFIGTDRTGTLGLGNGAAGVLIAGNARDNTIGDTNPVNQNVISSNGSSGIQLGGNSTGTQVLGNLVGTDRTGQNALGNFDTGILIGASGNQIGGTAAGAGNVFANSTVGVLVYAPGTGNSILSNSIFGNSDLGILLEPGGNNDQPAPILTSATQLSSGMVQITGSIDAAANTTYTIQIFTNASSTQPAQGKTLLRTLTATTNANGAASFVLRTSVPAGAPTSFTATATDPANNTSTFSVPINLASLSIFAVGADVGGAPLVNVYNTATGKLLYNFMAYASNFTGGVRVAVADVTGDGVPEIITGPGPGGGADIRVFNGESGTQIPSALGSFMAFAPGFTGGVYVAAGDVNGDGHADIIVGAGAGGGPIVTVYSGADGTVLSSFGAYDASFTGGVTVAAGNVTGTGLASVICGPGAGGGPVVRIFNGTNGTLLQSFFAFDQSFTGGVYVAASDVEGTGQADIIAGAGAGGGPVVNIFNGLDDSLLRSLVAFPSTFTGGVRVGAFIQGGTGQAAILTGVGPGGAPLVNVFDGITLAQLDSFFAFDPTFTGGLYVAGA